MTRSFLTWSLVLALISPSLTVAQGKKQAEQQDDRDVFHYLLDHRADITRKVTKVADGVETITESMNAEVAGKIKEHVTAMHRRVKEGRGIHLRDPLFVAIFKNYSSITMEVTETEHGVKVRETSKEPFSVKLIQAHADVVSKFIAHGHAEVRKNHEVPAK